MQESRFKPGGRVKVKDNSPYFPGRTCVLIEILASYNYSEIPLLGKNTPIWEVKLENPSVITQIDVTYLEPIQ